MKRRALRTASAFTLIELLVVISIIAILASILIPVMGKARDQSDSTKCLHNLRQIGAAIASYSGEHDDRLPGPLVRNQFAFVTEKREGQLAKLLGPYLGLTEVPAGSTPSPNSKNPFLCPAFSRLHGKMSDTMPVYGMNMKEMDDYNQPPWGVQGNEEKEPLKRSVLTTWREDRKEDKDMPVNLSTLPAMKDTDQLDTDGEKAPKPDVSEASPKPVHNDHRNTLFYDFHAARADLDIKTGKAKQEL